MADREDHGLAGLRDELHAAGFDVFQPMSAKWYNDYLKALDLATDSTTCACASACVPPPRAWRPRRRSTALARRGVGCIVAQARALAFFRGRAQGPVFACMHVP